MSTSGQGLPALTTTVERRFYSRIVPHAPIFVCMDGINQSLLLNVSENGLHPARRGRVAACQKGQRAEAERLAQEKPPFDDAELWPRCDRKVARLPALFVTGSHGELDLSGRRLAPSGFATPVIIGRNVLGTSATSARWMIRNSTMAVMPKKWTTRAPS